jgi:hypothetical protein
VVTKMLTELTRKFVQLFPRDCRKYSRSLRLFVFLVSFFKIKSHLFGNRLYVSQFPCQIRIVAISRFDHGELEK